MRGGFLRFQAQYLRRIRLPNWADVPEQLRRELAEAALRRDLPACNEAVFKLYHLSLQERDALQRFQITQTANILKQPGLSASSHPDSR